MSISPTDPQTIDVFLVLQSNTHSNINININLSLCVCLGHTRRNCPESAWPLSLSSLRWLFRGRWKSSRLSAISAHLASPRRKMVFTHTPPAEKKRKKKKVTNVGVAQQADNSCQAAALPPPLRLEPLPRHRRRWPSTHARAHAHTHTILSLSLSFALCLLSFFLSFFLSRRTVELQIMKCICLPPPPNTYTLWCFSSQSINHLFCSNPSRSSSSSLLALSWWWW